MLLLRISSWRRLVDLSVSVTATLPRRCSSVSQFSDLYNFSPLVLDKLHEQGLTHPTDIQQKSLKRFFEEKPAYTVINAETGSGKTLCYLLPILEQLARYKESNQTIPTAFGLVLVPTPLLAHQVVDVFGSLAQPEWGSSLSIKGNKLSLMKDTHLIVATPNTLRNFSITKLVQNVRYLCIDEADLLLTGGEETATWNVLYAARKRQENQLYNTRHTDNASTMQEHMHHNQVIFAAATLPSGGPMTINSRLRKWLPKRSTLFVTTELTHHILPSVDLRFTDVEHGLDLRSDSELKSDCDSLKPPEHHVVGRKLDNHLIKVKMKILMSDLDELKDKEDTLPRVLVFTKSQESANNVYQYLLKRSKDDQSLWWRGKVHIAVAHSEFLKETMNKFKSGESRVLVCTDLVSRGLDMPAVTAVIQFDFPGNSADFLHRAGRTARAGNKGLVISYVKNEDQDLAAEIKTVVQNKSKSFDSIFSRNKMLRRKINRRKAAELKVAAQSYRDMNTY